MLAEDVTAERPDRSCGATNERRGGARSRTAATRAPHGSRTPERGTYRCDTHVARRAGSPAARVHTQHPPTIPSTGGADRQRSRSDTRPSRDARGVIRSMDQETTPAAKAAEPSDAPTRTDDSSHHYHPPQLRLGQGAGEAQGEDAVKPAASPTEPNDEPCARTDRAARRPSRRVPTNGRAIETEPPRPRRRSAPSRNANPVNPATTHDARRRRRARPMRRRRTVKDRAPTDHRRPTGARRRRRRGGRGRGRGGSGGRERNRRSRDRDR